MGFGRIGRNILRILNRRKADSGGAFPRVRSGGSPSRRRHSQDIEIVAISDIADHAALEYLLRFDTVLGRFPRPVHLEGGHLHVGGRSIKMLSGREPGDVDWKNERVDYVVEATARYRARSELERHLESGARRVILCAPPVDEPDITVVFGVNEGDLTPAHRIISNGSCTSNAVGPVLRLLQESYGIRQGFLTTVHAYTNDQRLADVPAEDLRHSRAAAENIIPTKTRAHELLMKLIPSIEGRLGGLAMNVPVPDGSVVDLVTQLERPANREEINELIGEAAAGPLMGILEYEEDPIVSSDVIANPHSGIFDSLATQQLGDDLLRLLIWFDNGWGYAHRAVDLIRRLSAMDDRPATRRAPKEAVR
jgi:glyceraldehyde 3-phosphate dehydrogenase